jgi:glycosyltransferase involved in cell wall biosynthesis
MENEPTICLNMIVKNESKNMRRLFTSLKGFIDDYVIMDTGSTDNTRDVIKEVGEEFGIPGHIGQSTFKNFGFNRTESLKLAQEKSKSDYILLLDADMVLKIENGFSKKTLWRGDVINIFQKNNSIEWYNMRIFKRTLKVTCVGVTHEYYDIGTPNTKSISLADGIYIQDIGDGGAKDDKYERDIRLLKKGIEDEPNNARYHFYLAQTLKDCNKKEEAIDYYKKRIDFGGWDEEVWYSHYQLVGIYLHLNNPDQAEYWANKGYSYRPKRSEALYTLCKYFREKGNHKKSYHYYSLGKLLERPKTDGLFVEHKVYQYLFDVEYSIIHYYLFPNNRKEGLRISMDVLNKDIGEWDRKMIFNNMKWYITPLNKTNGVLIDINDSKNKIDGDEFHNSSPCLIKLRDGKKLINIRNVNYHINKENGGYSMKDNIVRTHNEMFLMKENKKQILEVINNSGNDHVGNILGLEDVRIFENKETGKVNFLAVSKQYSYKKNWIGTVYGDYDYENGKIIIQKSLKSPDENSYCEKNWVFANSNDIIYKWCPIEIGQINQETNQLEIKQKIEVPKVFSYFRGSTSAFEYKDMLWFIVHSVHYENPRTYLNYIVVLNKDTYKPILYSLPFSFEGDKIEYTLGLIIEKGVIQIGYSQWDSTAKIINLSLGDLLYNFIFISENTKAEFHINLLK